VTVGDAFALGAFVALVGVALGALLLGGAYFAHRRPQRQLGQHELPGLSRPDVVVRHVAVVPPPAVETGRSAPLVVEGQVAVPDTVT
jgi:hypothetical protein